jgi:hypothetical protein
MFLGIVIPSRLLKYNNKPLMLIRFEVICDGVIIIFYTL